MTARVVVVPRVLMARLDGEGWEQPEDLDPHIRSSLLADGWTEELREFATGKRVIWMPPEDAILRDEEETMSKESERHHREVEEAAAAAAHLAQRDQNDADVQEIARQVGVFCRGLDEAEVKHPRFGNNQNQDRINALQIFVITEVGRLRSRQDSEGE